MTARLHVSPSGSATCGTCELRIARGALRIAATSVQLDQTVERYFHLACFVEDDPNGAITALLAAPLKLRRSAEQALTAHGPFLQSVARAAAAKASPPTSSSDEFDTETELVLAQLAQSPRDVALLSVLQDHLQDRGLIRGELIALELARGPDPARLIELKRQLWPVVKDVRVTWGTGFLRTMSVTAREPATSAAAAAALAHPSARLLEELTMERWSGPLPVVPTSLLRLELRTCEGVSSSLAALERLRHLQLSNVADADALHSASLTSLGIGPGVTTVPRARSVPRVSTLVVTALEALPRLAAAGLLQQATVLVFPDLWEPAAIDVLAETKATWKQLLLPRFRPTEAQRRVLTRLSPSAGVMHTDGELQVVLLDSRPEWGLGRVRARTSTSLEVEFDSGVRTFAPDIRLRWLELLSP